MVQAYILLVASLPLLFRLVPILVPAPYLESYNYWSSKELNLRPGETVQRTRWRNMGYWEVRLVTHADSFPDASEALAQKLIDFADAPKGGAVLDVAHGSGESLRLHLQSDPPPSHLHGLTSLSSESAQARDLIDALPHPNTTIQLFVSGASFRPGKDIDHPFNPMRGYLGKSSPVSATDDTMVYEDDDEAQDVLQAPAAIGGPPPYDLIYVLDAIYHFPPAIPHFLASALKVLRPGEGVIAYTDILPPPKVNNVLGHLVLPPLLSVPARNIVARPKDLEAYKELLDKIGFEDVRVEDWSQAVWPGFALDLQQRGLGWRLVAWIIGKAEQSGWRFIAVRARRPAQATGRE